MPTEAGMTYSNRTGQCNWFSENNWTEPHLNEPLDAGCCYFLSLLPYRHAIPALICVFVSLTLFSFLLNGLTLFGLGHSEDLSWEPRSTLLKNLILSDLIQTFTFGPAVIHSLVQRRTMVFSTWCYFQYFVGSASIFSSLVTITCMALERYLYVCHAIHYLVILTKARLRVVLSIIWGYAISIGLMNIILLHMGREQHNDHFTRGLLCEPDTVEQHMGFPRASAVYRKIMGSLTLLLCLLVYTFSYVRMYQDARNAVIPFNAVNTTARKTVVFYCGMLFLQLLPLLLKSTSDALWEIEGTAAMVVANQTLSVAAATLHMSLLAMLIVPPCINPLVFGFRNAEMRKTLLSLFPWWRGRRDGDAPGVEWIGVGNVARRNRAQAG